MNKICNVCNIEKSTESFSFRSDTGKLRNQCKDCVREASKNWKKVNPVKARENSRRWYKNNREKDLAIKKQWNKDNPEKVRDFHLLRNFGITHNDFKLMELQQDYVCAICRKPETAISKKNGNIRNLHVDHDHNTGKVRGLLCTKCNIALGYLNDDVNILERMIVYLKRDYI